MDNGTSHSSTPGTLLERHLAELRQSLVEVTLVINIIHELDAYKLSLLTGLTRQLLKAREDIETTLPLLSLL